MRTIGARHSLLYGNIFSKDIEYSANTSDVMKLYYDENTKQMICGTGRKLSEIYTFARLNGRMIDGMPMIDKITVGGAISVGAHGGGLMSSTLSSQIAYMTILDNKNIIKRIDLENDLKVLRTCFGLCGSIQNVAFHTISFSCYELVTRKIIIDDVRDESIYSISFDQYGNMYGTFKYKTIKRPTYIRNFFFNIYCKLLSMKFILMVISFLVYLLPVLGIILIFFDNWLHVSYMVIDTPFTILPNQKAITMECGVPIKHEFAANNAFREMLISFRKRNMFITYRAWCRYVGMDKNTYLSVSSCSDVICFEITMDLNQYKK